MAAVDCLRGLAALSVCLVHVFTSGPWIAVARFGWLGVYVFFVISGFVVPYSLFRGGYVLGNYHRFIAKRMIRLDPPYFVSIVLAIGLRYLLYWIPRNRGPEPHYTATQILMHVAYLNSFLGGNWIQVVYWTLGIEFQYYLIVGLLFPLLVSRSLAAQLLVVALCVVAMNRFDFPLHAWSDQGPLIGHYAFVFLLGVLAFRYRTGLMQTAGFAAASIVTAVFVAAECGPLVGVVALSASVAIAFFSFQPRWLLWLGFVSYSLYLTHGLVGPLLVGAGERRIHSLYGLLTLDAFAVMVSLAVAYALATWVEGPAKRLASCIPLAPAVSPETAAA